MYSGLNELRRQLQEIDEQVIRLLAQRQHISHQIGVMKRVYDMDIEQPEVWERQNDKRMQLASELQVDQALIKAVFDEIHASSKAVQQQTHSK